MSQDPFDQYLENWIRDTQYVARVHLEDARAKTLIKRLIEQGHQVSSDTIKDCLYVDADTPHQVIITMDNAREMEPDQLLRLVKEKQTKRIQDNPLDIPSTEWYKSSSITWKEVQE